MGKKKDKIQAPMGETKVLLHTCCAPCSSAIIEAMLQNGITPVIYYCNPNIYPYDEYLIRKNECTRYAESLGLEIIDDDYDHEGWLQAVKGMENEPERGGRCLKCFKLRLLRTAEYAAWKGVLDTAVPCTVTTGSWYSAYLGRVLPVDTSVCCGISMYMPQSASRNELLNVDFAGTDWYSAAGWREAGW